MTAPIPMEIDRDNNNDPGNDQEEQTEVPVSSEPANLNCQTTFNEEDEDDQNSGSSSVQVAVRVRPFLPREAGTTSCISIPSDQPAIRIGGVDGPTFTFDHALPDSTTQTQLYTSCVVPLVKACLKGYNATVLAYGQTGSGKTHTIVGSSIQDEIYASDLNSSSSGSDSSGVIPRAFKDLFQALASKKEKLCEQSSQTDPDSQQPYEYEVRIQFLEIYGEEIRDLLSPSTSNNRLTIRDGAAGEEPEVIGATETTVQSTREALICLDRGFMRRVTAATQMNTESSRSHAIMSVTVEQRTLTSVGDDAEEEVKRSKFHFVDLAGSERQKRTKAEGQRLKEGIDINKGLLVLGNVISALGDSKKVSRTHVPYRDSKLTRLLKGSLGGNHKTLMIACVSPASINMEESLNCLRYANRAKNIQNNAVVNLDAGSRLVADLRAKCKELAGELLRVRDLCKNKSDNSIINLEEGSPFSERLLMDLLAGKDAKVPNTKSQGSVVLNGRKSEPEHIPDKEGKFLAPMNEFSRTELNSCKLQLAETEAELVMVRQSARQAKYQVSILAEQYYAANAEKEYYRLQLPNELQHLEDISPESDSNDDENEFVDHHVISKEVFMKKIAKYEKEFDSLRKTIRESKLNNDSVTESDPNSFESTNVELEEDISNFGSPAIYDQSNSNTPEQDDEEDTEEREVVELTRKYLTVEDFEASTPSKLAKTDLVQVLEEKDKMYMNRKQHLDEQLSQLTKNISEKEELVEQLNASQGKYEIMRSFYEDKLQEMADQVKTREQERELLKRDLEKVEKDKDSTAMNISQLQSSLQEKDKRINYLKKQQAELSNLTKVSSRNVSVVQRMQQDIAEMKKQRTDLQRQVMNERKSHLQEVQKLKKEASFRDKEIYKWKQQSNKNSSAADNARRVARSRLEEISKLRMKYRDAEKKLRKQTVKAGALARAGVDPAMVGRSDTPGVGRFGRVRKQMNVDQLRKFLFEKVTDVGKMEMIAEKIANEWEEHLELLSRKEDILENSYKHGKACFDDDLEAVAVQIRYKENRIRKLTRKLNAKPSIKNKMNNKDDNPVSFLEEKQFKSLSSGMSPLAAVQSTCKVLFGMVVRERRRVANLARTACNLDIKCIDKEKLLQSKDAAFRSHVEEEKAEVARLAKQHQEDILSLMSLVKDKDQNSDIITTEDILARGGLHALESEVRALRNDRNEKLLYKKKAEEARSAYKRKETECEELEKQVQHLSDIVKKGRRDSVTSLSSELRSEKDLTDELSNKKQETPKEIDVHLDNFSRRTKESASVRGHKKYDRSNILALIESSDEEEAEDPEWADDIMADLALIAEGELPPSLLPTRHSPTNFESEFQKTSSTNFRSINATVSMDSVFDRLSDPHNFTGVQKQRQYSSLSRSISSASGSRDRKQFRLKKKDSKSPEPISKTKNQSLRSSLNSHFDKVSSPSVRRSISSDRHSDRSASSGSLSPRSSPASQSVRSNASNSVYERLQDPSNFTGIQKAKFDSNLKQTGRARSKSLK